MGLKRSELDMMWGSPMICWIGRQDSDPSLELFCSAGREGQTRLVQWLSDPG